MSPRAAPMSPEQRRAALVEATLELLRRHGRGVTTRQIAAAAGVAEGTIFRVFDSKDDLVDAAIARAFVPGAVAERLAGIDRSRPFEERMVAVAEILQQRYRSTFELMGQLGLVTPPPGAEGDGERHRLEELLALVVDVIGPDAADLVVPADELAHRLRLLVFVGSHPALSDGRLLTPEQAVDTVLHGLHRPGRS
ncbi:MULTISPECIES: TetR/AcrR family transcriptional regulator [unclassified Nocardioides]|uniref:TetR/AcrR family transcriptional regulator n=1 Tax=unclassified Nocardioides TaxID=2615069 RepID=UPI001E6066F0|nr:MULTISPECIES: TetR/AcrR family transcriptional regulator [unclassified Nocardioides]